MLSLWAWGSGSSWGNPGRVVFSVDPSDNLQATLEAAAIAQHQGKSVEVVFKPGRYLQSGTFQSRPNPSYPKLPKVSLVAEIPGTVIFSGADVWQAWATTDQAGIYQRPWPEDWGFSGNPWQAYNIDLPLLMQRGELVWVNQHRLRPVLTTAELEPGTFCLDFENQILFIAPAQPLDWEKAQVDVSRRRNGLTLNQAEQVHLKNLIFQQYGGTFTGALTINHSKNITVDHSQFLDNNWTGLNINHSQQITVSHSLSANNGMRGLGGAFITDLTVDDFESRGNNWRGDLTGYYDWDAGEKFFYLRRANFTRYRAINNYSAGLWFDSDYQDIVVDQSQLIGNAVTGLFIEAGPGPITVKNSVITQNYSVAPNYLQTPGLFAWAADNVTLENNIIAGNRGAQLGIRDLYQREVEIPETQSTQTFVSRNWHLKNNWIMATQAQEWLVSTLNATPFLDSLKSQANHWLSYASNPFGIEGERQTFLAWQAKTQADLDSIFLELRPDP